MFNQFNPAFALRSSVFNQLLLK